VLKPDQEGDNKNLLRPLFRLRTEVFVFYAVDRLESFAAIHQARKRLNDMESHSSEPPLARRRNNNKRGQVNLAW
jgi:hypothetical protein